MKCPKQLKIGSTEFSKSVKIRLIEGTENEWAKKREEIPNPLNIEWTLNAQNS